MNLFVWLGYIMDDDNFKYRTNFEIMFIYIKFPIISSSEDIRIAAINFKQYHLQSCSTLLAMWYIQNQMK